MIVYVQFSNPEHTEIVSVFAGPQPDGWFDNLGEVEDDDPRYIKYMEASNQIHTPEYLAGVKKDELLKLAAIRIAPLQDAVDLDEATNEEVALLKKWKQYRIAVNRISQQTGYPDNIVWPTMPEGI